MGMAKVRIALIGCGGAASVGHLPWIRENPQADFLATCDCSIEKARTAAKRWDASRSYSDGREMFEKERLDAVVVTTPPSSHLEIVSAAAEKGIHVLLEKPMAPTAKECDGIMAAAERHNITLMMGHEKRFSPGFQKIKELIDQGVLGTVFYLVIHWSTAVRLDPERLCPPKHQRSYEWRWKDPSVGGGIVQDHLPHYLDLWRWWTGSELETVYAQLMNVRRDIIGDKETGGLYEDFGTVLMKFKDGCTAYFETGTVGRGISPILHLGSGRGEWSEYGLIYGTRGHLIFDVFPWDSVELPRIMVFSLEDKRPADRGWYQVEFPDPWRSPEAGFEPFSNTANLFRRQMDHFISCVAERREPRITGHDGKITLQAIEAVYKSQETGQAIRV